MKTVKPSNFEARLWDRVPQTVGVFNNYRNVDVTP